MRAGCQGEVMMRFLVRKEDSKPVVLHKVEETLLQNIYKVVHQRDYVAFTDFYLIYYLLNMHGACAT